MSGYRSGKRSTEAGRDREGTPEVALPRGSASEAPCCRAVHRARGQAWARRRWGGRGPGHPRWPRRAPRAGRASVNGGTALDVHSLPQLPTNTWLEMPLPAPLLPRLHGQVGRVGRGTDVSARRVRLPSRRARLGGPPSQRPALGGLPGRALGGGVGRLAGERRLPADGLPLPGRRLRRGRRPGRGRGEKTMVLCVRISTGLHGLRCEPVPLPREVCGGPATSSALVGVVAGRTRGLQGLGAQGLSGGDSSAEGAERGLGATLGARAR
mmetsp:Transcript_18862/g.65759  ORF Transcript_18862/g.65759 Transcript_18862/m.65759 type:complete len:268 (-) Transcript_18862:939-1742(-)